MPVQGKILDLSPLGMTFTVVKTSADTGGKSLDLLWELAPGCNMKDALVHIHPHAIETYKILEGEMEFFIKDKWMPAKQGDHLIVPLGVTHAFRNPSGTIVKLFNTHEPALRMQDYFEDVSRILDKLTKNRTTVFKMDLKAKTYLAVLMNKYREEIIAKRPPDAVLRMLGFAGKLLGVKIE